MLCMPKSLDHIKPDAGTMNPMRRWLVVDRMTPRVRTTCSGRNEGKRRGKEEGIIGARTTVLILPRHRRSHRSETNPIIRQCPRPVLSGFLDEKQQRFVYCFVRISSILHD